MASTTWKTFKLLIFWLDISFKKKKGAFPLSSFEERTRLFELVFFIEDLFQSQKKGGVSALLLNWLHFFWGPFFIHKRGRVCTSFELVFILFFEDLFQSQKGGVSTLLLNWFSFIEDLFHSQKGAFSSKSFCEINK